MVYGGNWEPEAVLELSDDEREQLTLWSRRCKSSQALALRAQIVLACGDGVTNKDVAMLIGCSAPTVTKWRSRFVEHRLGSWTIPGPADRRR